MNIKCPSPRILATLLLLGIFAAPSVTLAQSGVTVQTVVTAITKSNETTDIPQNSVSVHFDGKAVPVSGWVPLRGPRAGLELVLLLDDDSRTSLGLYLNEIKSFFSELPPSTSIAVGYMENGSANLVQGLTNDRNAAMNALRLPLATPGGNGNPYFCLSDLIKRWPAPGADVRREVIMITNGVDIYSAQRGYDPEDPYVQQAISDAQSAGVIVYSIYFTGAGRFDRSGPEVDVGQNYLSQVSSDTGGRLYYQGIGSPVSFTPYLSDIERSFENQYELSFMTQPKKDLQPIKIKTTQPNTKLQVQQRVLAGGAAASGAKPK